MIEAPGMAEQLKSAVRSENAPAAAALLSNKNYPVAGRIDGLVNLMKSASDAFMASVFDEAFCPDQIANRVEPEVLATYLWHEAQVSYPARTATFKKVRLLLITDSDQTAIFFDSITSSISLQLRDSLSLQQWTDLSDTLSAFVQQIRLHYPSRLDDLGLLRCSMRMMNLDLMQEIALAGDPRHDDAEKLMSRNQTITLLLAHSRKTGLQPHMEAIVQAHPYDASAIFNLARNMDEQGVNFAEIALLYNSIRFDPSDIACLRAVTWAARRSFDLNLNDISLRFYSMLPQGQWPEKPDDADAQRTVLGLPIDPLPPRSTEPEQIETEQVATEPADAASKPPRQPANMFEALLEHAAELAFRDKTWSSLETSEWLESKFGSIASEIETCLRTRTKPCTMEESISGALRMQQIADAWFRPYRFYVGVVPYALTQQYGEIDTARLKATHDGLMRIAALISAIQLDGFLAGAAVHSLSDSIKLIEIGISSYLAAGDTEKALSIALDFEQFSVIRRAVMPLKELCLLQKGDIAGAIASQGTAAIGVSTLRLLARREAWSRIEDLNWSILASDPVLSGTFEIVKPSGALERHTHAIPTMNISVADHDALMVVGGEMLIGRSGAVLRPAPLHHPVHYPRPGINVLNWGEGGVRLRDVPQSECAEPVVVLENFDALILDNYYHWTVLLLPRIHAAKSFGLLNDRKLVIPARLKGWMEQGLNLIGIEKKERLNIADGDGIVFQNAKIVSTVEFASSALLLPMREKILRAARETPADSKFLYLSRRGFNRRSMLNEDKLEELARRLGFQIIAPETLTVAQQAVLFSNASGIAATEGAALANSLFSPPGTRVLTILNGNDLFPTFNDMAIVLGHHHRKLTGTPERRADGFNFLWSRYSIDLDLAERHLLWVMGKDSDDALVQPPSTSMTLDRSDSGEWGPE